jgi:hypothetical protein
LQAVAAVEHLVVEQSELQPQAVVQVALRAVAQERRELLTVAVAAVVVQAMGLHHL